MPDVLQNSSIADHRVLLGLIREYYAYDEIPFDESSISKGLELLLREPEFGRAFLIAKNSELAGYLILTFGFDLEVGGRLGVITDLYLRPQFRRQGLGSVAMESLFEIARSLGLVAIQLQPERDNTEALAFYTKLGFVPYDRIPMNRSCEAAPRSSSNWT